MPNSSFAGAENYQPIIKAKAAAYTATVAESGTIFTNRGGTAVIAFTLPAVAGIPIGVNYTFYNVNNAGMSVNSNGSLDNIVTKNDATADSITCSTNSLAIGAAVHVIWDGTAWLSFNMSVGPTYTVA